VINAGCKLIIRKFLEQSSPITRFLHDWLLANGFEGVFKKYLKTADKNKLDTFFSDFSKVDRVTLLNHRDLLDKPDRTFGPGDLEPVTISTIRSLSRSAGVDQKAGDAALKAGVVAAAAFAGGAATRFKEGLDGVKAALPRVPEKLKAGFDASAPKGCFPISPVEGLNFFEMFLAQGLETGIRYGRLPACLLMTSAVTDENTKIWLHKAELWGMPKESVGVFRQRENPRLDADGDLLVSENGHLAWTGDGHGGIYFALQDCKDRGGSVFNALVYSGVNQLVMFNIDNAASRPFFARRLGNHVRNRAGFTMTAVRKTLWSEKVGVACLDVKNGVVEVIEYNSMAESVARKKSPDGGLMFSAANINVNIIDLVNVRSDIEPTIYSKKTVIMDGAPHLSSSIEYLNQHITRKLNPERISFYEVERGEFFIPTKNPVGVDSAVTTFHALSDLYAGWLEKAGAKIAKSENHFSAIIDLHPCTAMESGDIKESINTKGWMIDEGAALYLGARLNPDGGRLIAREGARLEGKSTLIVRVEKPYGNLFFDPVSRTITPDVKTAGKFLLGKNVTLSSGVTVEITIKGNGICIITDGRTFDGDVGITVGDGEKAVL